MVVRPLAPGAVPALSAAAPQEEDEKDHEQEVERRVAPVLAGPERAVRVRDVEGDSHRHDDEPSSLVWRSRAVDDDQSA